MLNVIDKACKDYRYVIVDIGFSTTPYAERLIEASDLMLHLVTQEPKVLAKTEADYTGGRFGTKLVAPIVMNYFGATEASLPYHEGTMVGEGIDENDVKAKFEDGVLSLVFPKEKEPELPEKKTIAIEG